MPTWCHMFNSTLIRSARVWFDDLPPESVDSYDDQKEAFLANFRQQKKCIKDPVEIHHIKQREGESTEDFVRRFKVESRDVKGAPEIMRISGFMHGITNPELIKRLHIKISKSVDEMMRITTSFLRGEVAAGNQERKKSLPPWKQQEAGHKQNFKKGGFKSQQRSERRQDRFTLLSKSLKEILALEKGKFKTPPPMTTPVEKRNNNKFCEFHGEVGHNTDECMHLKRQIEELLKNGKLSHVIKELKQNSGKDQPKANKIGETSSKDKALAILMVQPCRNWGPLGQLSLPVKIGDEEHSTSNWMNFVIVRSSSPYNGIIGRLGVRKIQAVPSTAHEMLKFPVVGGILTIKSSKIIPIECAAISEPEGQPPVAHQATEERIKVAINPDYPEQTIMIGSTLTEEGQNKLCDLRQRNLDVFAWKPADMIDVLRHIAEHRLNIREGCPPVRQKGEAKQRTETRQYKKKSKSSLMPHDGSWRMCVDFKDLNKACPKDGYPLPKIDWKVESVCGFPFKYFLDAYKGYHQIKMAKEDEEKTSFITSQGIFCYSKMPFGLRNARATYQRLVDKAFNKKIGRNLELNPKERTFGVEEGMFLGYKVNTKGIKVCPDKVDAVLSLPSPKCLKDVQKLNGKLASLNRFLAKSAEKSLPFFKTLKKCTKKSDFHWTEEAKSTFKQMKQLIAELPTLTAPEEKEELIVYLAAAKEAVSAVLMTEREAKKMPIYFVSRALRGPEVNYTSMENLVLALVHTSKRLKRYFQAHPIIVITDQPIKQVLSRPEVAGRLQK
ncbi:reverse transcriptase domain-containing protein [Tanacetum coccineum]